MNAHIAGVHQDVDAGPPGPIAVLLYSLGPFSYLGGFVGRVFIEPLVIKSNGASKGVIVMA